MKSESLGRLVRSQHARRESCRTLHGAAESASAPRPQTSSFPAPQKNYRPTTVFPSFARYVPKTPAPSPRQYEVFLAWESLKPSRRLFEFPSEGGKGVVRVWPAQQRWARAAHAHPSSNLKTLSLPLLLRVKSFCRCFWSPHNQGAPVWYTATRVAWA